MVYILCAVEMLIENKKKDVVWDGVKRHIENAQAYLQRFFDFKLETVTTVEMAQLIRQKINNDADCTVENIKKFHLLFLRF